MASNSRISPLHLSNFDVSTNRRTVHHSGLPDIPASGEMVVLLIGSSIAGSVFALQLLTHPSLRSMCRPIMFDGAVDIPGLHDSDPNPASHPAGQSGAAVALTKQAMYLLRQMDLGPELEQICQNTEHLSMYRQPFFGPQDGSPKGIQILGWDAPAEVGIMGGLWTVQ